MIPLCTISMLKQILASNRGNAKNEQPDENAKKKPTVRQRMLEAAGMEVSQTNEANLPGYINVVKNQR